MDEFKEIQVNSLTPEDLNNHMRLKRIEEKIYTNVVNKLKQQDTKYDDEYTKKDSQKNPEIVNFFTHFFDDVYSHQRKMMGISIVDFIDF